MKKSNDNSQIFQEVSLALNGNINTCQRNETSQLIDITTQGMDCLRDGELKRNRLFLETDCSKQPQGYMEAHEDEGPSIDFLEQTETRRKKIIDEISSRQEKEEEILNLDGQINTKKKIKDLQLTLNTKCMERSMQNVEGSDNEETPNQKDSDKDKNHFQGDCLTYYRKNSSNQSPDPKKIKRIKKGRFFSILLFVNGFLFNIKKILLFFRPQKLNSLQLELIGDVAAQNYDQDGYGVPYTQCRHSSAEYGEENQEKEQLHHHHESKLQSLFRALSRQKTLSNSRVVQKNNKKSQFMKKLSKTKLYILLTKLKRKLVNLLRRWIRLTLYKIPLIDPNSSLFRLWEMVIYTCDTINLIYIPFRLSFATMDVLETYFYSVTFPMIYGMNIFFNLNVSSYSRGTLISSRQKILTNYLSSFFIIDALAFGAQFINPIMYLGRIFYSNPTIEQLKSFLLMNPKLNAVEQFLSLSFTTLFFCHFFSCAWHMLGKFNLETNEGWMVQFSLINETTLVKYITCFYYAVVTMSTIGYGDITAKMTNERILMIFTIFFACGLYGYTLNSIGTILSNMKSQSEKNTKKQAQLEEYLSLHEVDVGLRNRARRYIQYAQEQESILKRDGQDNLNLLNSILREEIQKDINKKILAKASSLFSLISQNTKFLEKLSSIVKEQTFGPEEIIYIQSSSQPPSLYIIAYGEVQLFIKKRGILSSLKVIKNLGTGSIFGQYEFFTNNQTNCLSARSVGVTYISSISLDDFQVLLQEFEEEKENFYNIRDSVLLNRKNRLIRLHCLSCQSDSHCIADCPYLFYDPIQFNHNHLLRVTQKIFNDDLKLYKKGQRKVQRASSFQQFSNIQQIVSDFQLLKKDLVSVYVNDFLLEEDEDQEAYDEGSLSGYLSNNDDTLNGEGPLNENRCEETVDNSIKQKKTSIFCREGTQKIVQSMRGLLSSKTLQDSPSQDLDIQRQSPNYQIQQDLQQKSSQQYQIINKQKSFSSNMKTSTENLNPSYKKQKSDHSIESGMDQTKEIVNLKQEKMDDWLGIHSRNSKDSRQNLKSSKLEVLNDVQQSVLSLFPNKSPTNFKDQLKQDNSQQLSFLQNSSQLDCDKSSQLNIPIQQDSKNNQNNQSIFVKQTSIQKNSNIPLINLPNSINGFGQSNFQRVHTSQHSMIGLNPQLQQLLSHQQLTQLNQLFQIQHFQSSQQQQLPNQQQQILQLQQQILQMNPNFLNQMKKIQNIGDEGRGTTDQQQIKDQIFDGNTASLEIYSWESQAKNLFESQKNYQKYFPHNNFEILSSKWNDNLKIKQFKRTLKRSRKSCQQVNKCAPTPRQRKSIYDLRSLKGLEELLN